MHTLAALRARKVVLIYLKQLAANKFDVCGMLHKRFFSPKPPRSQTSDRHAKRNIPWLRQAYPVGLLMMLRHLKPKPTQDNADAL